MTEDIRIIFNSTVTSANWINQTMKDTISKKLMEIKICVGHPLWLNDSEKVDRFYKKYAEVRDDVLLKVPIIDGVEAM